MGTVRVVILPWADVFIDGQPRGRSPVTATVTANAEHTIRVDGAASFTRHVHVAPGAVLVVSAEEDGQVSERIVHQ